MFGAIVASRPVITTFETVSPTEYAFQIPAQPPFSHIVVFLLPGNAFPDGTAGGVYIQIPPSTEFKFLGALANDKQSAIFKISATSAAPVASNTGDDVMVDDATAQPVTESVGANIILGISVEPIANVEAKWAQLKSSTPQTQNTGLEMVRQQPPAQQQASTKVLAQRIIKDAFNFLSSFATGSSGQETVPLKAFQDWWSKFEKKIDLDPGLLERAEQNR